MNAWFIHIKGTLEFNNLGNILLIIIRSMNSYIACTYSSVVFAICKRVKQRMLKKLFTEKGRDWATNKSTRVKMHSSQHKCQPVIICNILTKYTKNNK